MKKFEYTTIERRNAYFSPQELNEEGKIGWELVAVSKQLEGTTQEVTIFYFKREIQ